MKNKFYSHIVKIEPVHERFEQFEIEENLKEELLNILHSHIHLTVIDIVLNELDNDKKKEFLHLIGVSEDNSGAWDFVITNIEKGEEKVNEAIDKIVNDFVKDLDDHSY